MKARPAADRRPFNIEHSTFNIQHSLLAPATGTTLAPPRAKHRMSQYILRRFIQMIPITFGILTLVFSLIHLIPGDPARQIAGENAREEDIRAVRKALGLDQPLWTQYITYLAHVVRGDLGRSFQTND